MSEVHAQFAKEAMACQSLDGDEILNVRWATEDPNPVAKVAEKRRIEDIGQEVIRSKMDPRIVDAMRTVRALEDGDILDDEGQYQDEEMAEAEPQAKRAKIEAPEPPKPLGLLSADTLEGLKYFAQIRQRNGGGSGGAVARAAPPSSATGLSLADYGSDED